MVGRWFAPLLVTGKKQKKAHARRAPINSWKAKFVVSEIILLLKQNKQLAIEERNSESVEKDKEYKPMSWQKWDSALPIQMNISSSASRSCQIHFSLPDSSF